MSQVNNASQSQNKPETMSVEQATRNIAVNQVKNNAIKDISQNWRKMLSKATEQK